MASSVNSSEVRLIAAPFSNALREASSTSLVSSISTLLRQNDIYGARTSTHFRLRARRAAICGGYLFRRNGTMEAWIVWMLALSIAIVAGWVVGVVMALVFGMLEVYSAVWVCYL